MSLPRCLEMMLLHLAQLFPELRQTCIAMVVCPTIPVVLIEAIPHLHCNNNFGLVQSRRPGSKDCTYSRNKMINTVSMVLMVYKSWVFGVQPCLGFSCASLLLRSAQQPHNPASRKLDCEIWLGGSWWGLSMDSVLVEKTLEFCFEPWDLGYWVCVGFAAWVETIHKLEKQLSDVVLNIVNSRLAGNPWDMNNWE